MEISTPSRQTNMDWVETYMSSMTIAARSAYKLVQNHLLFDGVEHELFQGVYNSLNYLKSQLRDLKAGWPEEYADISIDIDVFAKLPQTPMASAVSLEYFRRDKLDVCQYISYSYKVFWKYTKNLKKKLKYAKNFSVCTGRRVMQEVVYSMPLIVVCLENISRKYDLYTVWIPVDARDVCTEETDISPACDAFIDDVHESESVDTYDGENDGALGEQQMERNVVWCHDESPRLTEYGMHVIVKLKFDLHVVPIKTRPFIERLRSEKSDARLYTDTLNELERKDAHVKIFCDDLHWQLLLFTRKSTRGIVDVYVYDTRWYCSHDRQQTAKRHVKNYTELFGEVKRWSKRTSGRKKNIVFSVEMLDFRHFCEETTCSLWAVAVIEHWLEWHKSKTYTDWPRYIRQELPTDPVMLRSYIHSEHTYMKDILDLWLHEQTENEKANSQQEDLHVSLGVEITKLFFVSLFTTAPPCVQLFCSLFTRSTDYLWCCLQAKEPETTVVATQKRKRVRRA